MDQPKKRKSTCPHCKSEEQFSVWESVNVTLQPSLKNQVLTRGLGKFTCSNCARVIWVGHPIHYHDVARKLMIWFPYEEPRNPPIAEGSMVMKLMVNGGYAFRIVNSFNELIEKIRIFDDGRDDRALELLKLAGVPLPQTPEEQKVFYDGIVDKESGEKAVRLSIVKKDGKTFCEIPLKELQKQTVVVTQASVIEREKGKWLCADKNYASALLRGNAP
jgi:hypothetical protein